MEIEQNDIYGCNSWVIVEIATGRAVMETWNREVIEKLNQEKYMAMTTYQYLIEINRKAKK